MGKAFYKGGFEPKMNRREAALILQLRYGSYAYALLPESYTNGSSAVNANSLKNAYERITERS